jgi:RNA polymerase sigma-70 factor (ECF subfamily)
LIIKEGYLATSGDALLRADLSTEAIRLGSMLADLLPDEPEVLGLLSLMVLHDSRRGARADENGDLIPLEEQDRALWDRGAISRGFASLEKALSLGAPGPYQIQAAIAAEHARARDASKTDWEMIAAFYSELVSIAPSPVVALNRAAAIGMAYGPRAGLELLDAIAAGGELDGYFLLDAARADLLRRDGAYEDAKRAYERALSLCEAEPERRYLRRRLVEVRGLA